MPNVVLDSSSVVGAFLKEGSIPERAVTLAQTQATIVLSPEVEAEIREVLGRPKFRPYATADREERLLLSLTAKADLLVLHPWRGIDILTPAEFVARFT